MVETYQGLTKTEYSQQTKRFSFSEVSARITGYMSQTESREMIKILSKSVFNWGPGLRTTSLRDGRTITVQEPEVLPKDDDRLVFQVLSLICDACPLYASLSCRP